MKLHLLSLLLLLSFIGFSQTSKPDLQKQKEEDVKAREKFKSLTPNQNLFDSKIVPADDNKPFTDIKGSVVAGSKEYDELKAKGVIQRYEIKVEDSKAKLINISNFNNSANSQKVASNTPCDYPPVQGTQPWGTTLTDDATTPIALPFNFCFYGATYTACRVGTNGNIQFGTSNVTAFSSVGFPSTTVKMVAPFWSDLHVNVASGGLLYGKVYVDIYPTRMVVSWDSSAYYNQHVDKLNSFQCVITDGTDPLLPPGKNVGFYYKTMQWTTGDASAGTNGFPTTQPGTPATVGANEGNGTDYFLIGRFGVPGAAYDGPLGNSDGVSWLNGKKFFFNVCPPVGGNQEPISALIGYCDTLQVCGNDTLYIKNTFLAPEVTQSTTITVTAPTLGASFSYTNITSGNSADVYMIVNGNTAPGGYHTVTMTAVDNGTPVQSSTQTYVVYVNQAAINNLNGSIVITPTLGACPGQTVSASVIVNGGVPDSYLWNNNAVTASTSFTTAIPADSIVFVTLKSGQCKKTIVSKIHISPVPVAVISGNTSFCNGNASSVALTASSSYTAGNQAPYTYAWTGTGTLTPNNTQTTNANAGVYTVTVTNQFGCKSVATQTVMMNESPSYSITTNAVSGGSVYCATQDTARLAFHYATSNGTPCGLGTNNCIVSNSVVVGTATGNTSATATTPFANLWGNTRHQYLFRASELTAAGLVAGKISSIAFGVTTVTGLTTYPNFTIKLKCVATPSLDATFDNTGLVQVYSANTPITTGLNTCNFTAPYIWDGTSNILVDVCHSLSPWTNSSAVLYNTTTYNSVRYDFSDTNPLCGSTAGASTSTNRPNVMFSNCLAQQSPSQFNVTVTPTLGVVIPAAKDSIKIDLPNVTSNTCYTITVTNPIGGCVKDTVICVFTNAGAVNPVLTASTNTVCIGQSVVITGSGAATYTISYIQSGTPVVISTNPSVTHIPLQVGLNTYVVTAGDYCTTATGTYTLNINVVTPANLVLTPLADQIKCLNATTVLTGSLSSTTPGSSGLPYSYSWGTLPGNVPAPGNNTSNSYTVTGNTTTTLVLTASGTCANSITDTVVVSNYPNNISVAIPAIDAICANTPFTLQAITSGNTGASGTVSYAWFFEPNPAVIGTAGALAFTSPGTQGNYTISVTATDICGYSAANSVVINVLPPCSIEIPNIITPNGDNANDFFKIKGIEFHPNSNITIFDRWGRKIYENPNYNNEWKADGVLDGTYFYVLDVPSDKKYSGFISVFKK